MTHLYNCKKAEKQYRITKFDDQLNVESSYLCTETECECPAGHRPTCRHRQMLPKFLHRNYVDCNFFFDYDRGGWVEGWREPEANEGFDKEMQAALEADGEKLRQLTGEDHGPYFASEALPIQPEPEPSPKLAFEPKPFNETSHEHDEEQLAFCFEAAELGQASDSKSDLERWSDIISGRYAESIKEQSAPAPQPSPSSTIRRRV